MHGFFNILYPACEKTLKIVETCMFCINFFDCLIEKKTDIWKSIREERLVVSTGSLVSIISAQIGP